MSVCVCVRACVCVRVCGYVAVVLNVHMLMTESHGPEVSEPRAG